MSGAETRGMASRRGKSKKRSGMAAWHHGGGISENDVISEKRGRQHREKISAYRQRGHEYCR